MKFEHKYWHLWFAWHPVNVDGRFVWLKKVERRADCYFTVRGERKLLRWLYRLPEQGIAV